MLKKIDNIIHPFYLELELVKPVMVYLKEKGYIVRREIRIGYHRADIVGFKRDNTVAVELKINDWKKAIVQAKNYQLGADYVYIAVPLIKSFNILRKAELQIKNCGIGLLVVNEKSMDVKEIIKPKRSNKNMCSISI
jgi:hypothetical protein